MNHMRMQGSTKIEPSSTMTKQFLGRTPSLHKAEKPYTPPIPFRKTCQKQAR
ncbi:unnamed protein product [Prunus brigantina]